MQTAIDSNNNSYIHQSCYYNTVPRTIATPQYPNKIITSKKMNKKLNVKKYLSLLCACFLKNKIENI